MKTSLTIKGKIIVIFFILVVFATIGFSANLNEAQTAIDSAEKNIAEMSQAGFTTAQISSLLDRAKEFLSAGNYDSVIVLTNQINITKERAFYLKSLFDKMDEDIFELSQLADVSAIKEKLRAASSEFYRENYAGAEGLVNEASSDLENLKSQLSLQLITQPESGFVKFVRDNVIVFLLAIALILIYYLVFYEKVQIQNKYHKLQQLEEMEKNTRRAMERTQEDYFVDKKIDSYEYHTRMRTFRKHLANIKRERLIVNRDLKKLEKKIEKAKS